VVERRIGVLVVVNVSWWIVPVIKISTALRIVNILLAFAIALFLCVSKRSERGMGRAFHCFFITGRRFISTSFKSLAQSRQSTHSCKCADSMARSAAGSTPSRLN